MGTIENLVNLYLGGSRVDRSMEQLSLLELCRSELARFELAVPGGASDTLKTAFYQRLLPYLRLSVPQAQERARSLKIQMAGDA